MREKQIRSLSAVEAATNVAVGCLVALALTATVLPAFGYRVTGPDAVGISLVFTAASLLRSYALRRAFNRIG